MANNILEMALERLERDFPPSSLSAWFDDATVVSFTDNRLILHSPVEFKKEFIEHKFIEPLQNALYELTGDQITVVVVTGEYTTPSPASASPYDDYTFERFIVGSSNKFAHAGRARRGPAPRGGKQPAVHLRQLRPGQDPPDVCDRKRAAPHASRVPHHLCQGRGLHQRADHRHSGGQCAGLPQQIPHGRSAAARRRAVHRRQGAHAGGVLPYLQRAVRGEKADRPHLGPAAQGDQHARGPHEDPFRVGPARGHPAARL